MNTGDSRPHRKGTARSRIDPGGAPEHMTNQPTEAVIAGSKAFALALLAPLTERVGTRPRIAADPSQVLKLTGGSGLVVVEFQGERSLEAIRLLRGQASGLDLIAAVPDGHLGAEEALRALGVEPARWDGRPDGVLSAVSRRFATGAALAPAAAPPIAVPSAAAAPAPPAAPAPAAGSGVGALFDDLGMDDGSPDPFAVDAGPRRPPAQSRPWPANVPGSVEAAEALSEGLRGVFAPEGAPLAVVAEVMAGMSPLERSVLRGEPQPIDTEPVRRAAVMRVRVAVALVTAPQAPGAAPTDPSCVSALLAEIDGLLSDVNAVVASAPAEVQPSLEQVRNALVKEAIDFSEAAHRAESAGAVLPEQPSTTGASRRAAQARVVSVASKAEQEIEVAEGRRRRKLFVALTVAVVAAGAFHGWRFLAGRAGQVEERSSRTGAPADAVVSKGPLGSAPVLVHSKDGRAFTPEELKRMQDEEALRGNTVREATPGTVMILPSKSLGDQGAPVPAP